MITFYFIARLVVTNLFVYDRTLCISYIIFTFHDVHCCVIRVHIWWIRAVFSPCFILSWCALLCHQGSHLADTGCILTLLHLVLVEISLCALLCRQGSHLADTGCILTLLHLVLVEISLFNLWYLFSLYFSDPDAITFRRLGSLPFLMLQPHLAILFLFFFFHAIRLKVANG